MQVSTRRSFAKALPLALGALSAAVLSRCIPKKERPPGASSSPSSVPQEGPTLSGSKVAEAGSKTAPQAAAATDLGAEAHSLGCPSNEAKVDLDKLALAPEAYEAKLVCYGSPASALVALSFPKYQHGELQTLYLCDHSGRLIAQQGIWQASQVREDRTLRPVVFEHLQLAAGTKLVLVLRTSEDRYFRYPFGQPLAYLTSFAGRPVRAVPLGALAPATAAWSAPASVFAAVVSGWQASLDAEATIEADAKSKFAANPSLAGLVITDLMGVVLSEKGGDFTAVAEHELFVCYRLEADGNYTRALSKVL